MPEAVGFAHSEETKRKIGEAHKGKVITLEQRRAISEKLKGQVLSDETKKRMSEARKGRAFSEHHKQALSGKNNHYWKGDSASYTAKHQWMYRHYGKASRCELEDSSCKGRFEWSNKTNEYKRERDNWWELCRSHHIRYDRRKV